MLLGIIYLGFISLGLPDTVLGVAWGYMRSDFDAPVYFAGILTLVLTVCSTVSSIASGSILLKTGTGRLLMICGFMTGFSLLGYAFSPVFWLMALLAIPLGFGQGAVDTGMNFYVARHHSSRVMNWLHCCWGIGASAGPTLLTLFVAAGFTWRWGYAFIGIVQIVLAVLFLLTLKLWNESPRESAASENGETQDSSIARKDLRFWLCTLIFLSYTGMEASIGLWGYTFLVLMRNIPQETAGYWVACYWGMLTAGRFLVGIFADKLGNRRQIRYSAAGAMAGGILLSVSGVSWLPFFALALLGFSLAAIFPAMMHETPKRFNNATASILTGYQGAAGMIGIAVIPPLFGFIAYKTTFSFLPFLIVMLACLIFIMQVAVDGWKITESNGTA